MNNGAATGAASPLVHDRFTTGHLGLDVYRLTDTCQAGEAVASLRNAQRPVMIEAKVPVDRVEAVARLTSLGFRVIDLAIQLDADAGRLTGTVASAGWTIRDARPSDRPGVERVSGENLTTSRFHLDPRIDNRAASALKAAWAGNFFEGRRGDRLLVVDTGSGVAGFLLTLERGHEGVIDLVALDPAVRGTGALGGLVQAWIGRAPGLTRLIVGTQASNVRSLRAYASLGFRVCGASYVLHHHT